MKFKNILIPSLMVGMLASCNIDEVYYSETTAETFLTSRENIDQMVARPFAHWSALVDYMFEINEHGADCVIRPLRCDGSSTSFSASYQRKRNHTIIADDGIASTAWKEPLQGVARCLDVLANLETINYEAIGLTEDDKKADRGQMNALMGYFYMLGLDWVGGLPLYTSNDSPLLPRSTAKETFEMAENLLTQGVEELPARVDLHQRVAGNLKKAAAAMILAELYFNAEVYIGVPMYDKAAQICQDIIDGRYGPYEIEPRWQDTFGWTNHTSSEILWGVPCSYEQKRSTNYWSMSSWYPRYIQDYLGLATNLRSGGNTYCLAPSRVSL